jgi:hypothetical protein
MITLIPFFFVLVMMILALQLSRRENIEELNKSLENINSIENMKIN